MGSHDGVVSRLHGPRREIGSKCNLELGSPTSHSRVSSSLSPAFLAVCCRPRPSALLSPSLNRSLRFHHSLPLVQYPLYCRTSAATSFFGPIAIGPSKEEFVDGALGANNPIYTLWTQAQDVWGRSAAGQGQLPSVDRAFSTRVPRTVHRDESAVRKLGDLYSR